jgi:hypothetical protein
MRFFLTWLMVGGLLLAGFGGAPPAGAEPRNAARDHSINSDMLAPNLRSGAASSLSTLSPLPSHWPAYLTAPQSVPEGQIGAAPNPGPITGYGPGGMGRIPRSLSNPPY